MKTNHLISDLALVSLAPPAVTLVWWLYSRFLMAINRTTDNSAVQGWTKSIFWLVLGGSYALSFGMFLYAYLVKGR